MSIAKKSNRQNSFYLEEIRDKLAREKKYSKFKETYKKHDANLNNNTGSFWNHKFKPIEKIDDQDGMTKDKISFISKQLSNLSQPIDMLDIGIGQAYLEQKLQMQGINFNLSTIDISNRSINRARMNYKARGIVDDALRMDKHFKDKPFDAIIALEVIEHISPGKIFSLYKKVHALLKDDGFFIISTPMNEGLKFMKDNPNAHVREYTPAILEAEFKLSNFKIEKQKTLTAFQNLYTLKKIISKVFANRWKPNNIIIVAKKT